MPRRLCSLLLVFVVAVAPAVLTACELVCAARDAQRLAQSDAAGHSCHGTQPSSRDSSIDACVESCGHSEALPAASHPPLLSMPALAVVTPSMFVPIDATARRVHVLVSPQPGHSQKPLPLRI